MSCFRKKIVHVENAASQKVSGRSWKGFRKKSWKVFYRVQNTASRKVSGRSRKGFQKRFQKALLNFSYLSIVGSPERLELVPGEIRKETGRYPEATFAEKCNLRARAHLVTVNARLQTCPPRWGRSLISLCFGFTCQLSLPCNSEKSHETIHAVLLFWVYFPKKKSKKHMKKLSPGRYPEGPKRVSGSKPGKAISKTRWCKTF
jgi:hypothetical protein